MINNLKPDKSEVCLIYSCPDCGQEWSQTLEEVKFVGKIICYCDAKMKFEPVKDVHITIEYRDDQEKDSKENKENKENKESKKESNFEDVIVSLSNMGFKRSEAKKLVKDFTSEKDYENSEKLFEEILSRGI
tara:strand:+ start:57 stop:452 length:396 start_codon:yes stop_codon:yes gene_type:complete